MDAASTCRPVLRQVVRLFPIATALWATMSCATLPLTTARVALRDDQCPEAAEAPPSAATLLKLRVVDEHAAWFPYASVRVIASSGPGRSAKEWRGEADDSGLVSLTVEPGTHQLRVEVRDYARAAVQDLPLPAGCTVELMVMLKLPRHLIALDAKY